MGLIVRNINFTGNFRGTFPQVPPPPPAPPAPSDQYGAYTVLDLPGTGTNNSNNNVFVDSSANNFAITRVGNTTQGSFSPFSTAPGYWSNYFDGSGDYLTQTTNAAYGYGTADFTIEFWLYIANNAADQTIVSNLTSASSTNPHFYFLASDRRIYYYTANANRITGDVLSPNIWYHIALSRESGSTKLFINGVKSGLTYADTNNYGSTAPLGIGTYWTEGSPFATKTLNGYISNLRIVKGTAVYTTDFTPPTTPLTAISGTSLLTCQSNRFVDNSSNAFAITRVGDTSVSAFGPFAPANSYNSATMGGSMYFDGSGDTVVAPAGAAFAYGTGAFTIEAWVNTSAYNSGPYDFEIVFCQTVINRNYLLAGITINGYPRFVYGNSGGTSITGNTQVPLNTWTHLAWVREGTGSNQFKIYMNGVVVATSTVNFDFNDTSYNPTIGDYTHGPALPFKGYISNLRIVKGTAVYTANFTPPTAPVTAISGTSLLLNGTNAAIYDASTKNNLETLGNAVVSTTVSASGSMYFDGSGDYLMLPPAQRNLYLTGAFTWETWLYQTTSSGMTIYGNFAAAWGDNDRWSFVSSPLGTFSNSLKLFWYRGTYGYNQCAIGSTTGLTLNTWNHIAIVRDASNNIYIFLNGQQLTLTTYNENITWSNSVSLTNPAPISINGGPDYATGNGYINNMRMTQGIARYTANFTPPTRS